MRICASIRRPATMAISLIALLLTVMSAHAGTLNPVKLRVSGKEVALKTPAVFDGREVYVPLEALRAFNAGYSLGHREETAVVALPNGTTVEIALARPGRQPMLPLSLLLKNLKLEFAVQDGQCDVQTLGQNEARAAEQKRRNEADRIAREKEAREAADRLAAEKARADKLAADKIAADKAAADRLAKAASKPSATQTEPKRIVEIPTKIADWLKAPATSSTEKTAAKGAAKASDAGSQTSGQPAGTGNTGTSVQQSQPVDGSRKTAAGSPAEGHLTIDLPPAGQGGQGAQGGQTGQKKLATPPFPSRGQQPPLAGAKVRIQSVAFEASDDRHAQIKIRTAGVAKPVVTLLREPSRLAIDIPNSVVEVEQTELEIDHPFLNAIHTTEGAAPGTTRIVVDLHRLVGYTLLPAGKDGITLNLGLPRGVGRKMSDLVVVVDPGHGGGTGINPTGCSWVVNGQCIMEKNITLAIANKVKEALEAEGVTVHMTRTKDVSLELPSRPGLAAKVNADLFVSIHIDDCKRPNTASGSTAYYHMDDSSSRALAHSIIERIVQVSGLPTRRARSDRSLHPSGLSVLRNATVPAALIEVGFINNSKDRAKIMNDDFQRAIAGAFVAGIRNYTEGSLPDGDGEPGASGLSGVSGEMK